MDYLASFDIEADLAPLIALHNSTQQRQSSQDDLDFQFTSTLPTDNILPETQQPLNLNGNADRKVFFITNCGSLLGRTIAQVALDRGHYVAACAREKHLADLNVPRPNTGYC
jgi:hypothetical protein